MAEYTASLTKDISLLRVFTLADTPQPSPATILINTTIDGGTYYWSEAVRKVSFSTLSGSINIPAFFGQPLSANISEEEKNSFSIDITFPYGQTLGGNTLYEKELSVLYPKGYNIDELVFINKGVTSTKAVEPQPFFSISDLSPNYLYRVDIVDQNDADIIDALNSYYAETSTLAELDKVINLKSKEHYWCYLSDYEINKVNKDSTITFTFIDIGYKLSNSWNDLKIPESTFMTWANTQAASTYLFDTRVSAAITSGAEISFFDGWSIAGYLLAIMYYSYLFPAYSLSSLTLTRVEVSDTATYSITYSGKTVSLFSIPTSIESITIPISNNYPNTDSLVSNGFFNEVPPFQLMMDTLNNLSQLIGFFWEFDRNNTNSEITKDCMLRITSEHYNEPAIDYELNSKNIYEAFYDFDDSSLRNNISVLGRPYGLDLQYGATIAVDNSIQLFGYKNFVFESPLILSTTSAENIAKNIAATYAFNIGSINISMPYSNLIQIHQPIILNVDESYTTGTGKMYVSSRTISMERFKTSSMTLDLSQRTERTIVDFGAVLSNLSDSAGDASGITFEFKDSTSVDGYINIVDSSKLVSNMSLRRGYGYSVPHFWDFANDVNFFTIRAMNGDQIHFNYSYYDKDGALMTLKTNPHTYSGLPSNGVVFNIRVTTTWITSSSFLITVEWEFKKGYLVYTGPKYSSSIIQADIGAGVSHWFDSSNSDFGDVYYVPYELDADTKFRAEYQLVGSDKYGLVEGGFLVIPVSPVYRKDGIPFKGLYLDDGSLVNEGFLNDTYSLDAVIRDLNYYLDGLDISDTGELITYGALTNIAGLDMTNSRSSITTSVKTGLYLCLEEDNPTYTLNFTPFIDSDLGRLTYSNVMVLVPFIKAAVNDGSSVVYKILPKTPLFILHGYPPVMSSNNITFDYESGKNYLEYTDGQVTKQYQVSYCDVGSVPNAGDGLTDAYSLSNISTLCKTTFRYKSTYPFVLRLALNAGSTNLGGFGGIIQFSEIVKKTFVYYSKLLRESTSFTNATIYPFSNLEGVVKWISDTLGNGKRLSLTAFIDPFYMYSLADYVDNPNKSNANDRMKITPYLMASSDDTSFNSQSIATFINSYRDRYVSNATLEVPSKIADILIIDYNKNNFEG